MARGDGKGIKNCQDRVCLKDLPKGKIEGPMRLRKRAREFDEGERGRELKREQDRLRGDRKTTTNAREAH